jgi:hypothetical protein
MIAQDRSPLKLMAVLVLGMVELELIGWSSGARTYVLADDVELLVR